MTFNQWVVEKKVKEADLVFKLALKTASDQLLFQFSADQLAPLRPSFSLGLQLAEWLVDLILLDSEMVQNQILQRSFTDLESYKAHIKTLRFPVTSAQEQQKEEQMKGFMWPLQAKPKFERRGDKFGAEIKLFISNESDLIKAIAGLERVQQQMAELNPVKKGF